MPKEMTPEEFEIIFGNQDFEVTKCELKIESNSTVIIEDSKSQFDMCIPIEVSRPTMSLTPPYNESYANQLSKPEVFQIWSLPADIMALFTDHFIVTKMYSDELEHGDTYGCPIRVVDDPEQRTGKKRFALPFPTISKRKMITFKEEELTKLLIHKTLYDLSIDMIKDIVYLKNKSPWPYHEDKELKVREGGLKYYISAKDGAIFVEVYGEMGWKGLTREHMLLVGKDDI